MELNNFFKGAVMKDKRSITSPINGQHGGVKTIEGKDISKKNSISHGIFARYSTGYDFMSFEEVYDMFAEEFGDKTPSRKTLIFQLSLLLIRLHRCARFEAEYFNQQLDPPKYETTLVKKGNVELSSFDEYESKLISGTLMTLEEKSLNTLKHVYHNYESQFLTRFCKLVEILTNSSK